MNVMLMFESGSKKIDTTRGRAAFFRSELRFVPFFLVFAATDDDDVVTTRRHTTTT